MKPREPVIGAVPLIVASTCLLFFLAGSLRSELVAGWAIFQAAFLTIAVQRFQPTAALSATFLAASLVCGLLAQPGGWWIALLHATAAFALAPRPLRIASLVAGAIAVGLPEGNLPDLFQFLLRSSVAISIFGLASSFSLERASSETSAFEPIDLGDDERHEIAPALSVYLQQHLADVSADGVAAYQYDVRAGALEAIVKLGSLPDLIKQRTIVQMGEGLVGASVASGKTIAFYSLLKPPTDAPKGVTWEGAPSVCAPIFDPESASGRPLGAIQICGANVNQASLSALQQLAARLAQALVAARKREAEQIANYQRLSGIVVQVESQSPHTHGHSQRVTAISEMLAKELGLQPELIEKIETAALFHDIGKTRIDPLILNKEGGLTRDEIAQVRQYPLHSEDICGNMGFDADTLFLIRHHGERLDKNGYPDGLEAGKQPLALRILAVADVFDTLACSRSYRGSMSIDERLKELSSLAGVKLDVLAVETLRRLHMQGRLSEIYSSETSAA